MISRKIVANEIYNIRELLEISGDHKHDWWLAGEFLDTIEDESWDEDSIYVWFVQLEENLHEKVSNQEEKKWD